MEDGFDDEIQEFLMENELKEQQEYQEKATGPSTEPEPGMVNIEPILTPTSRKIQCDKWEKRTITFGNKFVSLERATGVITPLNRTEFKDLQMKHQDILISKLEAIAFHNLVINNITDLVHPFHLNDLAHQHIQSITSNIDQLMSVRGQVHHLDRPAPYTAIACTRGKAVLALTDLTIEAPVVVDIASTTNFVGPAPTLYNYPVLPGETFNLLVYVQRSHPDGGLRRYHGPRTKLASLWMKDCGAFTTNATALVLLRTYCYVMPQRSYCYECLRFRASTSLAQQYIIQKTTSHLQVILTHFLTYTTLSHIGNPYSAVAMVYALHREESSKDDRMEQVDDVQHSVKNDDLITGMPDVRWSPTNKFQLRLLVE
ncbi:hypothetical protein QR680_015624 [Steinernema hermaphroditum]|uniref:Uncharacterized protein n=1 Tax=Steinernema hermaphroditum TaxID=289476 RepID=A0AA39H8F8_9BILA|nr:hypothetical protein QR680_015624 [Steinernema hermaphroditum]